MLAKLLGSLAARPACRAVISASAMGSVVRRGHPRASRGGGRAAARRVEVADDIAEAAPVMRRPGPARCTSRGHGCRPGVVRTTGDPMALATAIRDLIRTLNPPRPRSMDGNLERGSRFVDGAAGDLEPLWLHSTENPARSPRRACRTGGTAAPDIVNRGVAQGPGRAPLRHGLNPQGTLVRTLAATRMNCWSMSTRSRRSGEGGQSFRSESSARRYPEDSVGRPRMNQATLDERDGLAAEKRVSGAHVCPTP